VTFAHEQAVDEETQAWARERGFLIGQPNVIAITKIRDPLALMEVLKAAYPPRYLRQNVEPFLGRLPLRIELQWPEVALLIDALRASSAFDYEVNPSS
jgi:hypothetical protein